MQIVTNEMKYKYGCADKINITHKHELAGQGEKGTKRMGCIHDKCPYADILEQYDSFEDYFANHIEYVPTLYDDANYNSGPMFI